MLNETNIRCFLCLARYLNFTRAAKELYMTQQSVSQQISRLERDLGFQLFVRDKHSVAMTMAGHRMFEFFAKAQQEYHEELELAKQEEQERAHRIYIGFQNWMDFGPASDIALRELRQEIPDLELSGERCGPGALLERVRDQRLDMIVMYDRYVNRMDGFEKLELFKTPIVVLVSPQNPLCRPNATYKDFIYEPFIFDTYENTGSEPISEISRRARREVEICGLDPRELIPVPSRDSAYTAAEMGKGIVISTRLSRIIRSSTLKMYPTDVDESIVCVWRKKNPNQAVEKFARLLQKVYGELEAQRAEQAPAT